MTTKSLASVSSGKMVVTAVDWANKKIQLLTLLPQLCPLFISNNLTHSSSSRGDAHNVVVSRAKRLLGLEEECLRDLCILANWPNSKKDDNIVAGASASAGGDRRVVPFPTVDDESGHEDHRGMCQTHKKLEVVLHHRDKFRSQFLRKLLAASFTATSVPPSHVDADPDTMLIPDVSSSPPEVEKKSVVKLLKMGLKSRYSSHLRKALRERDFQSTVCILSIIATFDDDAAKNEDLPHLKSLPPNEETEVHDMKIVTLLEENEMSGKLGNLRTSSSQDSHFESEHDISSLSSSSSASSSSSHWTDRKPRSKTGIKLKDLTRISQHDQDLKYYKEVTHRVLTLLKSHPDNMFKIYQIIDSIRHSSKNENNEIRIKESAQQLTLLRANRLHKFLNYMKRLQNLFSHRVSHFETEPVYTKSEEEENKQENLNHLHGSALSKRINELENTLSATKSKWKVVFEERESEIVILQKQLLNTRDEMDHHLLETVKQLEVEKIVNIKHHKQRINNLNENVDMREERLVQAITTLEAGYKGLRSYRKSKEAELRQVIHEYDDTIIKHRRQLEELSHFANANRAEMKRLEDVHLGMVDSYDEMRNTKRLRELLQNLQMAESVRENWAARRIQTAWKKYRARKLRKRKLKKPKGRKKKTPLQK